MIFEEEIKKSRFITHLAHTPGMEAAKAFVDQIKTEHASARHNCWGFVAGAPEDSVKLGFSDDGEPSGTAGKPILAQLKGSGVGEITAVVTRYSGGIKLGTGGLVKAYGGGVKQALELLESKLKTPTGFISMSLDYPLQNLIEQVIEEYEGTITESQFAANIVMQAAIPLPKIKEFVEQVFQVTQGKVKAKKL